MKTRNWFWGIFFLLSAVFVIASQIGGFTAFGAVTVIATILLAALLVSSIAKREIFGVFFSLGFLYYIYQEYFPVDKISWWMILIIVILLSTGFSILLRKKPGVPKIAQTHWREHAESVGAQVFVDEPSSESLGGEDVAAKVHFGASTKYLHSKELKRGRFDVSFGSLEVYFDNVQLSGDGAEIFLECSFSGVKLYVPRSWRIRDNTHSALSGVTNVNRFGEAPEGSPVLTLTGNIHFSGVEILYI